MLRTVKAKNARTKRFLDNRAPKVVENPKTAILIRGTTTSAIVNQALADLYSLKKPNAVSFTKKNDIHPFESTQSLEFFAQKNDAAHMVVGTHNKKRPHDLTFVRMFDYQVLDMYEFGIENFVSLHDLDTPKCAIGMKPSILFQGDWESTTELRNMSNLFLDFFRGEEVSKVNLAGLEYCISLTHLNGTIHLRVYTVHLKKSGQKLPRIELVEMGPRMDLVPRRHQDPVAELWKQATKVPREIKPKKTKNVETDVFGDKFGQLHMQKQDLRGVQVRKMKGLKKTVADPAMDEGFYGSGLRQRDFRCIFLYHSFSS
ncbi:ribosome production factor 2 [Catenaria anguillulae PL171]|uniref:Ribosome production factor 2 homolog n=1 Tax=Catenaria anguillulae PL171 TaxID=765915 RepID=A0A1Y2I1J2_9FUNG|nr:ribosome production factor 2 [Catenaria anguillulae PL171]